MLGSLFHIAVRCLKRVREERPDLKDMIENFGTDRRDDVRGKFLVHANTQFVEFYHAPSSEVFNRRDLKFKQGSLYTFTSVRVSFRTVSVAKCTPQLIPERYCQDMHAVFNLSIQFTVKSAEEIQLGAKQTLASTQACKHFGLWFCALFQTCEKIVSKLNAFGEVNLSVPISSLVSL